MATSKLQATLNYHTLYGRILAMDLTLIQVAEFLTIFGKNEQANLTAAEKAATKKWMAAMKKLLGEE